MRDTDGHTIYLVTSLSRDEVIGRLEGMFQALHDDESLPRDLSVSYYLNYVEDKTRVVNFGYLYLRDSRVFWLLVNKNPDGTDRTVSISVITDPPSPPREGKVDWNDLIEAEERQYKVVPAPVRFPYHREFNMRPATPLHNLHRDQCPHVLVVREGGVVTIPQLTDALTIFSLPPYRMVEYHHSVYLIIDRDDDTFRFLQPLLRSFPVGDHIINLGFGHRDLVRHLVRLPSESVSPLALPPSVTSAPLKRGKRSVRIW